MMHKSNRIALFYYIDNIPFIIIIIVIIVIIIVIVIVSFGFGSAIDNNMPRVIGRDNSAFVYTQQTIGSINLSFPIVEVLHNSILINIV